MRGRNLAAVAADADPVLQRMRERPRLYHCRQAGLAGFFEGLEHYRLLEHQPPPLPGEEYTSEDEEVPPLEIGP
jgi:hypothetical protein